jgi:sec-independent protein translocase protein TatB
MFGIGTWELVVILALALIVLGPKKLPEMAKSLGRGLASLRKTADDVKREIDLEGIKREMEEVEEDAGIDEIKRMVDVRGEIRRAIAELDEPLEPDEATSEPPREEPDKT